MSKKITKLCAAFALAALVGVSAGASACGTSKHPTAKITIEFNTETYVIEYMLYRNMYPQTVQHFIELADAGFYNDMIVHDYQTTDWFSGGYSYNGAYSEYDSTKDEVVTNDTNYRSSFTSSAMPDYLDKNNKENEYYSLVTEGIKSGKFSASVYDGATSNVDSNSLKIDDALPTVIGEFSRNGHRIEDDKGLTAAYGTLKMFYYTKDVKSVVVKDSFNDVRYGDYNNNCATSLFAIQVANSSSYDASRYAIFGRLKNDKAKSRLEDLTDAIDDYTTTVLGSTSTWTSSIATKVDKLDTYADDSGRDIDVSFRMTSMPIIIRSVKITKH